jgi:hypothetical protein
MWKLHQLIWKNYVPQSLEIGMWYINKENQVYILDKLPQNQQEFIKENGYPIELMLSNDENNVVFHLYLDERNSIAWWDEGDHTDEFRDITLKDINDIFENVDGYISVLVDDETEEIVLEEDKPILTFPRPEHQEHEFYGEEDDEEDENDLDPPLCVHCNGSGEGMWDGSTCNVCGGEGIDQVWKQEMRDKHYDI